MSRREALLLAATAVIELCHAEQRSWRADCSRQARRWRGSRPSTARKI